MTTLGGVHKHNTNVTNQPELLPVLPRLETTSIFRNWKFKIVLFLEQKGIHEVLLVKVKYKLRKKEDLKKKDAEARLWIVQSVDDKLLDVIRKCRTAREMIMKLEAWFQKKSVFTRYDLRKKLLTMKFRPLDNLRAHFLKFDKLISELEALGCKLEESDKVCHLLLTFPDEYKVIITSLDNMLSLSESENIMQFVKNHLLNSVMKATKQTTCSKENENSMIEGTVEVKSETIDQYQINGSRGNSMNDEAEQLHSEHIPLGDPVPACTDLCSPETFPQSENQCPDSSNIKLNSDMDLIVPTDTEPLTESPISYIYQLELFDENSLHENTADPEPVDADCNPHTAPGDNQELQPAELVDNLSSLPIEFQSDGLNPDPELVKEESPEELSSEIFCCKVVLQDAANRLWCAYCDQWCLSDTELQRHKDMHAPAKENIDHIVLAATSQNVTVDQTIQQSDPLTVGMEILSDDQEITTNTCIEYPTNSDSPDDINPQIPQTEYVSLHSSEIDTECINLSSNQSRINHCSPKSATDTNLTFISQSESNHFNSNIIFTDANRTFNKSGSNHLIQQTTSCAIQLATNQLNPQLDTDSNRTFEQSGSNHVNQQTASDSKQSEPNRIHPQLGTDANITLNQSGSNSFNQQTLNAAYHSGTSHLNPQLATDANKTLNQSGSNHFHQQTISDSKQSESNHLNLKLATDANKTLNQSGSNHFHQQTISDSKQSETKHLNLKLATDANKTLNQSGSNHFHQQTISDSKQSETNHATNQATDADRTSNPSGRNNFNPQIATDTNKSGTNQVNPQLANISNINLDLIRSNNFNFNQKTCSICNKTFLNSSRLRRHAVVHSGLTPFSCDICNKSYKRSTSLEYHVKSAHTKEKPFSCKICGKRFTHNVRLNKHVKTVHTKGKPFECEVCHQCFATKFYLTSHRAVHNREKPFKCDDCDKYFRTKKNLKTHSIVHSGKPHNYVCHVCGRSFLRKMSLGIHKSACYGTKKFICNECGQGFVRKSGLIVHLSVHNTDKLFKCKICKKHFVRQLYLDRHKVTHGERQYSCHVCGQRFFYKSTLNRHMKAPHSETAGPRRDRPPRK